MFGSDSAEQLGNLVVAEICTLLDGFVKRSKGFQNGFGRSKSVKRSSEIR
jgi:hypothetical protein